MSHHFENQPNPSHRTGAPQRNILAILAVPGWTQTKVSRRVGVSQSTVNRWTKGAEPEGHHRDALADLHAEVFNHSATAPAPSRTMVHRIEAHLCAVHLDELNFDDDGNCLNEVAAADSLSREADAFKLLVREQCATAADVNLKLDYFLNHTVGERSSLVRYLFEPSHSDEIDSALNVEAFLRSLVIPSAEAR